MPIREGGKGLIYRVSAMVRRRGAFPTERESFPAMLRDPPPLQPVHFLTIVVANLEAELKS